MQKPLKIGTRESKLAIAQAVEVKNRLCQLHPHLAPETFEIVPMKTTGDRLQDRSFADIGGKGLFTKEIEEALLQGTVDLAVHSMKDMPAEYPAGLDIRAILPREDPRDALLTHSHTRYTSLLDMPLHMVVGTSSVRRQAQLLMVRPDLVIQPIRGNVLTRLHKLEQGVVGATILALAGLKRLQIAPHHYAPIAAEQMLPAVGQGAIGVECRVNDAEVCALLATLNHHESWVAVTAERAFLKVLDGSCKTPLAALAELDPVTGLLHLRTMVASPNGQEILTTTRQGPPTDAAPMGHDAGLELKERGKVHPTISALFCK